VDPMTVRDVVGAASKRARDVDQATVGGGGRRGADGGPDSGRRGTGSVGVEAVEERACA
jgi:hypothetical protein